MKFSFKLVTKLIAVVLTVCCIATVFASADVTSFIDFPAGSWSDAALRAGVNNGLIQGKGDGKIAPKDYITRAETAAIINRAFGATVKADISQYTDVSPSKWYYAEMQKAVNMRTVEGVSATKINPEGYITREQVFAILARALVLSDTDETKLMSFADGSSVSSWARIYTAALVNCGYVNGNTENRLKPKDYITREEFAQIMHNIFKQYIVGEDYKLSNATYGTTVVRTPNLTLKNLVINGDLIIADGVGRGDITLKNVIVSGRILFRGGEGKVKIEDATSTGRFVIVHDVNGTVNFHNYRTHPLFKNIVLDTHATFLKPAGVGGGSVSPGGPTEEKFTIHFDGKDYFASKDAKLGDAKTDDGKKLSDALDNYKPEAGYTNKGFKIKDTEITVDANTIVTGSMIIVPIDELTKLYAIYDAKGGTMNGVAVYKDEANPFNMLTSYTLLTDIPTWTGEGDYTFAGWYTDKTTEQIVTTIPAGKTANVTLYAKWIPYSVLTFKYNSAKSDEDTVSIDVVIDKLPYGAQAITYIDAQYSFLKSGTSDKAQLTYKGVTTAHGGTIKGTEDRIILDGVNITSGGVLFTIEFSKAKDYAEDVEFDFGTVTMKEGGETLGEYTKKSAVINALTGLQTYKIEFEKKTYIVYEGEKIGDARQEGNKNYTLSDAFNDYINALDKDIVEFKGFVDADNKNNKVTATDKVTAGMTLTKIVADTELIKFDVIYDAGDGTVNGKKTYTEENAFDYETKYTLLDEKTLTLVYNGYEFKGWYIEGDSSKTVIDEIPVGTKGDVTVCAKWKPMKYDVTYDALAGVFGDGKSIYTDEDAYDSDADYTVKALVPQRDSYVFAGWYFDKDTWLKPAGATISKDTKADVTLYARWEPNVNLTFVYNVAKSDGDTVAIDVVMDELPYGINEINYIDAVYSFVKEGTASKAELAYDKVTSSHGGTLNGSDTRVTLDGVKITSGGVLFTIEFTKEKDYADNVTFDFGDVVIKKDSKAIEGYNKVSATIDALTGLQKFEIEFEKTTYIVYEGEEIGSAKAKDGTVLSDALDAYKDSLDDEIYIFHAFVDANNEKAEVKATDKATAGMTLTKIVAKTELIGFDVTYDAGKGTVNGNKTHTVTEAFNYEKAYTLLDETELDLAYAGYKFGGWYMEGTTSANIIKEIPVGTKGNATVIANWEIVEYNIVYDANGGAFDSGAKTITKDKAHTVENNYTIDKTLVPARDGYEFSGWYKEAEAITPVGDTINYLPKTGETITIYAGWEKVYEITFNDKTYIAYENTKIGDAKAKDGTKLSDAMQKVINNAPIGKDAVFKGSYKENNQDVSKEVDAATKATADMKITYEYVAIPYAVEYELNNGFFKQGVDEKSFKTYTVDKALTLPTEEHVFRSDEENDYDFKGWYNNENLSGSPVTEIPAGSTGAKKFWAKWEAKPKQGLGFFAGERDEDANTAVMYMTLTEVPYDIEELAYVELEYWYGTQISTFTRSLPFRFVKAKPLFEAESFEVEGNKIKWTNYNKPITTAELKANGGKLFELVFEFDEDISGKRIFKYAENGTVLKAKNNTQSTKYEIFDGSIPFNVTYLITIYEQNITDSYDAAPTYKESYTTGRDEEDKPINYTAQKKGFTIDEGKSTLAGINDGSLEIIVYYNRNKHTVEFNGAVYNFLYGHKLFGSDGGSEGTSLKAALDAHSKTAQEGYEWTYTTDTGIKLDLEADYDVTQSLKISAKHDLIRYDVIYNANGGKVNGKNEYIEKDVISISEGYTLDTTLTMERAGYEFKGWYDNAALNGEPVTSIPAGASDVTVYAKWERTGDSVLGFDCETDYDNKTVTVEVILSNIPKNIDDLAAIEIHYTQTPSWLKWDKATKKAAFDGKFTHDGKEGVLTWYNATDPITPEELAAKGGVLFTIVYSYDEDPDAEEIILEYDKDKTVLASSKVKEGTGYELEKGKITFVKTIIIEFNGTNYFVTKGGKLGDAKAKDGTMLSAALANYKPDAGYENKGFKIKDTETKVNADTIVTDSMVIVPIDVLIDEPKLFTVTLYEGKNNNKGSYEIESGKKITQTQIDEKLGDPATYSKMEGYTDSDGNVHEIAPELWYMVDGEWEIFDPDTVVIDRDIDIHLFTRFAIFYYDTDLEVKGIKIPRTEISIAYDSNTDVIKSCLDALTAMSDSLEKTISDIEDVAGIDLFQTALNKAVKLKIVDENGNILNPEVPVPLHKLITEELIMKEIDNYIDDNINNEEFIADILRNDTVVDMLLENESIRNKILSDEKARNKLLTTVAIKSIINGGEQPDGSNIIIDYVITNQTFKDKFIGSQALFDYIADDLEALYDKPEYHDMILDACVEFVIDVYFEQTISAPELVRYIDTVLDSPEFIADIEAKPELKSLFKNELKALLIELDDSKTPQETRDEVYAEIRGNEIIKDAIIDAVLENDDIIDDIMAQVRTDLSSANSQYKDDVITAIRAEFALPTSTLKAQIIETVKADLALGAASALRDTVITAIADDFNSSASKLKNTVITTAKTEITTSGSSLRTSILAEAATPGSDIAKYIKNYASTSDTIKQDIKPLVKDNADVKAQAKTWINANISSVKYDIKTAIKTDEQTLSVAIMESGYSLTQAEAEELARQYVAGTIDSSIKAGIDSTINAFFENDADVLDMVEDHFDTFYLASYDTIFDRLYADPDVFGKAYESYVSDSAKLENAFNKYVSVPANLETAVNKFIENTDNLADAIAIFVDSASASDIEKAADIYIEDDNNLIAAVNTYIADDDNLSIVFNVYKKDEANLKKAFETYIAEDGNLGDAIHTFATNTDVFDTFYELHLSEKAPNPDTFNKLFEAYYHIHVHDVADKAWNNTNLHGLVMTYVRTYTNNMVNEYKSGKLAQDNKDLADTIYKLLHEQLPAVIRQKYYEQGSTIKPTVDLLIEEEGTKLIRQYANNKLDSELETFIDGIIKENIGIIADDYLDGKLDSDIEALINAEINTYMNKLINDYISNTGDARKTLGELIPTYAQDAVDALKNTDAFKNTISDFTSGNGVRVNEENIIFISIISELMEEYDYDKIMTDFAPEKVKTLADKVGRELASKYVNKLFATFLDGLKDAEAKLQADIDKGIEGTEYKFTTTPRVRVYFMDDFVVDMYNKAMPKVADKLNSKELIAVNPYAQRLINKNWITELLDYDSSKVTDEVTGYSIKKGYYDRFDKEYGSPIVRYYDIALENIILLHDAVMWYGKNYPEATIEDKLDAVSALMGTYANKANDVIMHYINTGELPKGYTPYEIADKILDKVLGVNDKIDDAYDKGEDKYYENEEKILELVEKMKNFYAEKLDKDYTEVIDLKEISVYADDKAYPVYKIMLELYDENEAFTIDTLATAIFDSDNYHNINAIEKGMNKFKSVIERFKYNPGTYEKKIVRDAYKATLDSRNIKGKETGNHSVEVQRYFQYIIK